MAKKPPQEKFREIFRPEGVPATGRLEELVRHPWAGGIGFDKPPTKSELKTLAQAGFKYDETTRIAWKERENDGLDFGR